MFIGRRSQKSKVIKLHQEIIKAEIKGAHDQIQVIEDETTQRVSEIKSREKPIESLDGDNLADEFNRTFK